MPKATHENPNLPSAPPAGSDKEPLICEVVGGRLVMSIGIETLAWAATKRHGGPLPYRFRVVAKRQFAVDVGIAIDHQDEVGNTMLNAMLDAAIQKAADNGSSGLAYPNAELTDRRGAGSVE